MLKRRIYLGLSYSTIIGILLLALFNKPTGGDPSIITFLIDTSVVSMVVISSSVVYLTSPFIGRNIYNHTYPLPFSFGILSSGYKKIYFDGIGYFWCKHKGDKVYVYDQGFLHLNRILVCNHSIDIESLREQINKGLTEKFDKILNDENVKRLSKSSFSEWNGIVKEEENKLLVNSTRKIKK